MSKPKLILTPVALALIVLASPAVAEDSKTMSGSACQNIDDSRLSHLTRGVGLILNVGSARENIFCPVVKDLNKINRAVVMVIDRNPDTDISCALVTYRSDGSLLASQPLETHGFSNIAQPLNFGAQGAAANGSYYLACGLPPFHQTFGGSVIVNYAVVED